MTTDNEYMNNLDYWDSTKLSLETAYQDAETRIDACRRVYRDLIQALADSCIKHRLCVDRADIGAAMETLSEGFFADLAHSAMKLLENDLDYCYLTPSDADTLIEAAGARVMETFRLKPADYSGFYHSLRPMALPRQTTNPATLIATGQVEA